MGKFCQLPIIVDAVKLDDVSKLSKELLDTFEPDKGNTVCEICGKKLKDHGLYHTETEFQTVCPNSWLVTDATGNKLIVNDKTFNTTYVSLDKLSESQLQLFMRTMQQMISTTLSSRSK